MNKDKYGNIRKFSVLQISTLKKIKKHLNLHFLLVWENICPIQEIVNYLQIITVQTLVQESNEKK